MIYLGKFFRDVTIVRIHLFNFGIKFCPKMPSFLTIPKPDSVDRLSVANFATTIKPPPFDDSNFKQLERLILWLTAMRLMHVKEGKPDQFTPEEENAFDDSDNLFRGCIISVLLKILWIHISGSRLARICGMLLRLNMECLMPAVSCI